MGNLDTALAAQDRAMFNPPEGDDWTDQQKSEAADKLYDEIVDGKPWDENLEGYRIDMLIRFEEIMFSRLSREEKMLELNDVMHDYLTKHCKAEVEADPDKYCEA